MLKLYLALVIPVNILCVLMYLLFPKYVKYWLLEDGPVENAQAALYLLSCLVGLYQLARLPERRRSARWWLLPATGLFFFGEELDYGERLMRLVQPHLGNHKLANIHDLLSIFDSWSHGALVLALVIGLGLLGGWLVLQTGLVRAMLSQPSVRFLALAVLFLACSEASDLAHLDWTPVTVLPEELAELDASLAMVFAALNMGRRSPGPAGARSESEPRLLTGPPA